MTMILGLSGSLRSGSLNSSLLRAAAEEMPKGVTLEIGSIKGIPLYDGDVEANDGIPDSVAQLKERVVATDGLLLVTPEYNNSLPGVFKNAIDWLTRPPADIARVWSNRPVGVIGASPGGFGTLLSQTAWLPVLKTLGTAAYFGGRLQVSRAGDVFDANGRMVDPRMREQLKKYLAGFAEFVTASSRSK
ncbi:MAG TPA: NADPH-dependent FMN reductase [Gammaproteobacteria bacterium]|nr:NADPH-dependent FMN reductase [Gammaproteobacteria bacterium]